MSNYTQSLFFASKDLLTTGDANKIIYGSEIDEQLSRISTAIASKYDSATAITDLALKVPTSRLISSGTNLTGGGDLSGNLTLNVPDATTDTAGAIELSTEAEAKGMDLETRAITPSNLGDIFHIVGYTTGGANTISHRKNAVGWTLGGPLSGVFTLTHNLALTSDGIDHFTVIPMLTDSHGTLGITSSTTNTVSFVFRDDVGAVISDPSFSLLLFVPTE